MNVFDMNVFDIDSSQDIYDKFKGSKLCSNSDTPRFEITDVDCMTLKLKTCGVDPSVFDEKVLKDIQSLRRSVHFNKVEIDGSFRIVCGEYDGTSKDFDGLSVKSNKSMKILGFNRMTQIINAAFKSHTVAVKSLASLKDTSITCNTLITDSLPDDYKSLIFNKLHIDGDSKTYLSLLGPLNFVNVEDFRQLVTCAHFCNGDLTRLGLASSEIKNFQENGTNVIEVSVPKETFEYLLNHANVPHGVVNEFELTDPLCALDTAVRIKSV